MLYNFKTEKKEKIRDVIRVALVSGKFGVSLSPKNHNSKMLEVLKRKYSSKEDPKAILGFMTMSSGLWVLNSISKSDDGIKKYLNSFFLDGELRDIFLSEQTYLSIYMKALTPKLNSIEEPNTYTALNQALVKKDKKIISDYEGLRDLNKIYVKQGAL